MKRKEIERLILLRESGEISAGDRKALERETARDSGGVTAIERELEAICAATRTTKSETAVDRSSIEAILKVARDDSARRQKSMIARMDRSFFQLWRPAITYAAAALFLLFISIPLWNHLTDRGGSGKTASVEIIWENDLDQNLNELDQEISLALLEYSELVDSDRNLDELASELIELKEEEI